MLNAKLYALLASVRKSLPSLHTMQEERGGIGLFDSQLKSERGSAAKSDFNMGCTYTHPTVGQSMSIIMSFDFLDVFAASPGFFDICQTGFEKSLWRHSAHLCPE